MGDRAMKTKCAKQNQMPCAGDEQSPASMETDVDPGPLVVLSDRPIPGWRYAPVYDS